MCKNNSKPVYLKKQKTVTWVQLAMPRQHTNGS